MPNAEKLTSRKRFQKSLKIINAIFAPMRFDGGMTPRDEQMASLPACLAGGFGALIRATNQLGAGL
jgi:hypothetical protein